MDADEKAEERVGTTAEPGRKDVRAVVGMELARGQVIQELGWDSDADESLREAIMEAIDGDLVDEVVEAVDAVLLWWREEDGDLVDGPSSVWGYYGIDEARSALKEELADLRAVMGGIHADH